MAGSWGGEQPGSAVTAGFAERLLEVIDSGRRTATYKLALLLALLDLCARRGGPDGRPPDVLYTRQIAERVAAIYWPQMMPYRRGPAIETGLRWGELSELRPGDLDLSSRMLTVSRKVTNSTGSSTPTASGSSSSSTRRTRSTGGSS